MLATETGSSLLLELNALISGAPCANAMKTPMLHMEAMAEDALEKQVDQFLASRPGGERLLLLLSVPSTVSGVLYAAAEYGITGRVKDVAFVILLVLATVFIAVAVIYLRRLLIRSGVLLFRGALPIDQSEQLQPSRFSRWRRGVEGPGDLLNLIFDRWTMAICALIYGVLLGATPLILSVHSSDRQLQLLLILFMFCSNAVTGAVLYSIITLLRQSWHLAKRLDVKLFEKRTDSMRSYSSLLASVSIIAAIYIGLCQASIVFSFFSGPWVFAYAFFAFFVFLAIFYVPQIPIRRRLAEERDAALAIVERARTRHFSAELTPHDIDELVKLSEIVTRVLRTNLGLGSTDAWLVTLVGVFSVMLPYVSSLIKVLLPILIEPGVTILERVRLFDQ